MNNYSKQREIILETFKYLNHPTAKQIYDKVHQDNPIQCELRQHKRKENIYV